MLLELLRNLIVHRGALVDRLFMKKLKNAKLDTYPDCSAAELGKPFLITATFASRLASVAADAGSALLRFTDSAICGRLVRRRAQMATMADDEIDYGLTKLGGNDSGSAAIEALTPTAMTTMALDLKFRKPGFVLCVAVRLLTFPRLLVGIRPTHCWDTTRKRASLHCAAASCYARRLPLGASQAPERMPNCQRLAGKALLPRSSFTSIWPTAARFGVGVVTGFGIAVLVVDDEQQRRTARRFFSFEAHTLLPIFIAWFS